LIIGFEKIRLKNSAAAPFIWPLQMDGRVEGNEALACAGRDSSVAIARIRAVSEYLLGLYARSTEADAAGFSTFALDGMRALLDADKAWWGVISISEAGPLLQSSFLCGLPSTFEAVWETVKQDDDIAKLIAQTKNQTVSLESKAIPATHGLRRLADGFDVSQTISISVDLPDQRAFMFVSLYRGHERRVFTPEEQSINELLIPHLHAAWRQNLRERLRPSGAAAGTEVYRAFVDRQGKAVQYEDGFAAAVICHWPSWRGALLPLVLREAIEGASAAPGRWIGRGAWAVRSAPAGLMTLVELREATPLDRLTPRELQVVRLYAEGETHKDIARLTGLTPSTVRHYLREAYSKLNIDNKAALANLMGRHGIASRPQNRPCPRDELRS
jgi:DNA-binding CsgD family transcriptional regulator